MVSDQILAEVMLLIRNRFIWLALRIFGLPLEFAMEGIPISVFYYLVLNIDFCHKISYKDS